MSQIYPSYSWTKSNRNGVEWVIMFKTSNRRRIVKHIIDNFEQIYQIIFSTIFSYAKEIYDSIDEDQITYSEYRSEIMFESKGPLLEKVIKRIYKTKRLGVMHISKKNIMNKIISYIKKMDIDDVFNSMNIWETGDMDSSTIKLNKISGRNYSYILTKS